MANKQLLFGLHAVMALLQKQPERIIRLCVYQDRQDKKMSALLQLAKEQQVAIESLSRKELDQMTEEANHQGVVAFCKAAIHYDEGDLKTLLENLNTPPFILILDGVQDPHNLGACF